MAELAGPIGTGQAMAAGYLENTVALHGSEPLPPVAVLWAPTRALLGVRYLVLPPGMRPGEAHLRRVYDGADARVVEDPAALPRAFVAARARCVDDRAALALLRARAIAPAEEVLLADCTSPPAPEARIPAAPEAHITVAPEARIRVVPEAHFTVAPEPHITAVPEAHIMIDEPARVVVAASTDAPAWLVLTDTWFPGWRARV